LHPQVEELNRAMHSFPDLRIYDHASSTVDYAKQQNCVMNLPGEATFACESTPGNHPINSDESGHFTQKRGFGRQSETENNQFC
jgi:hypothetical protein